MRMCVREKRHRAVLKGASCAGLVVRTTTKQTVGRYAGMMSSKKRTGKEIKVKDV
jgi:hypothetical protein